MTYSARYFPATPLLAWACAFVTPTLSLSLISNPNPAQIRSPSPYRRPFTTPYPNPPLIPHPFPSPTPYLRPYPSHRYVWDVVDEMKAGRVVVLTTHSMEEADVLGDKVAIMARGRLRCLATSLRLKQRFGTGYHVRSAGLQAKSGWRGNHSRSRISR